MRLYGEPGPGGAERRPLPEHVAGGRVPQRPVVQADGVPRAGVDEKNDGGGRAERRRAGRHGGVRRPRRRRFTVRARSSKLAVRPSRHHGRLQLL